MTPPHQEDRHAAAVTFEKFCDYWFPRGVAYVRRLFPVLTHHDAEEATMDALSHVHASWGNTTIPQAMFFTILRRRAIDELRRIGRRLDAETLVTDSELLGEEALPEQTRRAFADLLTPEALYIQKEGVQRILTALNDLPVAYRMSLMLAAEGYTTQERAEIKGVSLGTERSHLHRGRTRFEQALLAHGVPRQHPNSAPDTENPDELAEEGEGK
ncbi:sigma factor-like helix-turn-helix DNA-binding protein [Streptomyces sp. NPDC001795]|uniref:sigma factor-like helix-turn-helix DNA-binding protein n=1 Tax=Streptomyces sp. NPDC001795 TaxID=3154525 RepID=UPI00331A4380